MNATNFNYQIDMLRSVRCNHYSNVLLDDNQLPTYMLLNSKQNIQST